jgi:hypothetical protein
MRKLALHLAIAFTTFAASASLTNIWKSLTVRDVPSETLQLPVVEVDRSVAIDEPGLTEIFREYGAAQTRHDRAFFERVETDDFMLFTADGETLTRSEDIQAMNSSPTNIVYELNVEKVEMSGNQAIVTSRVTMTQGDYTETWPAVDVCLKRAGRWQIRSTTEFDDNSH